MIENKPRSRITHLILFWAVTRTLYLFGLIPLLHYVAISNKRPVNEQLPWPLWYHQYFAKWDGAYLDYIIKNGYIYQKLNVFFPLYGYVVDKIHWLLPFEVSITTLSIIFSNLISLIAIIQMYKLTQRLYRCEPFAYYSSLFFGLNMCTRFYASLYTEGLYVVLSLAAMQILFIGFQENWIKNVSYNQICI